MKKFFTIIILILTTTNSAVANGLYTKCFIEKITHPIFKDFERKSFSQMKNFPSYEDFMKRYTRYYIPGINKILNETQIKDFKEFKFELREDEFYTSVFKVVYEEYIIRGVGDKIVIPIDRDDQLMNETSEKTFLNKYKVLSNSNEYIEYEPEDPRWDTKLILDKKNNILEIKTKILFLDAPYSRNSTNRQFYLLMLNDFKDENKNFDYSLVKPIEQNSIYKKKQYSDYKNFYPSNFSIFLKCKFKPFKENEKESIFSLNNFYTLLIGGFLALSGIVLFFWRFYKKKI